MEKRVGCFFLALAVFGLGARYGFANVIAPVGLAPGSQYQLIFVTGSSTTATSADIDYYDAFVSNEAAIAIPFGLPAEANWHAVASTALLNANVNAPSSGLPVYNTAGELVAAWNLYTGSLLTPVYYDQFGIAHGINNAAVWTGSDSFGVGQVGLTLGGPGTHGVVGHAGSADDFWMDSSTVGLWNSWGLYALSDPITVPVPEPATLTLLASALLAFGAFRFFRQQPVPS